MAPVRELVKANLISTSDAVLKRLFPSPSKRMNCPFEAESAR
jgi:hypothetical protein